MVKLDKIINFNAHYVITNTQKQAHARNIFRLSIRKSKIQKIISATLARCR